MYRNYSGRAVVCFMDGSYKLMFKETCLDCMDISFTICIRIPILRTLFIFYNNEHKGWFSYNTILLHTVYERRHIPLNNTLI